MLSITIQLPGKYMLYLMAKTLQTDQVLQSMATDASTIHVSGQLIIVK